MTTAGRTEAPPGASARGALTAPLAWLYTAPLSLLLCGVGLFTVSWDRLANIEIGNFNVKLPVVVFLASVVALVETPGIRSTRNVRVVYYLAFVLTASYGLAVLFGIDRRAGAAQFMTVVLGALVPMAAVERAARLYRQPLWLLNAFIAGGVFAAAFGLYQLLAGYMGLPQIVPYVGESGGLGRISSFAYEPAYFGYYLILVLGAMAARDLLEPRSRSVVGLLTVVGALALCNSRAVFLTVPFLLALSVGSGPVGLARLRRPALLLPLVLLAVFAVTYQPSVAEFTRDRVGSILDSGEVTSNAPRLEVYEGTLDIVREHPWGIGPGSLRVVAPEYGLEYDQATPANRIVANNIWLQSMLDGGVGLTLVQLAFVICVVLALWRSSMMPARLMLAGWLTVVIVAGMLTSFFYDVRVWTALGLAMALATFSTSTPAREHDERDPSNGRR